jgi:hypothetical protein
MSIVENNTKQILTAEEKEDKRLFTEAMFVLRAAEKAEKAKAKMSKEAEKEEKKLVDEAMVVLKRGEKDNAKKAKRAVKKKAPLTVEEQVAEVVETMVQKLEESE